MNSENEENEAGATIKQRCHPEIAIAMLKESNEDPSSWARVFVCSLPKLKIGKDTSKEDIQEMIDQSTHLQKVIGDIVV